MARRIPEYVRAALKADTTAVVPAFSLMPSPYAAVPPTVKPSIRRVG
jgi:hypothetical protein